MVWELNPGGKEARTWCWLPTSF